MQFSVSHLSMRHLSSTQGIEADVALPTIQEWFHSADYLQVLKYPNSDTSSSCWELPQRCLLPQLPELLNSCRCSPEPLGEAQRMHCMKASEIGAVEMCTRAPTTAHHLKNWSSTLQLSELGTGSAGEEWGRRDCWC